MVEAAKTPEDLDHLKDIYCNFLGHRNIMRQTQIDKFMMKGLELQAPEKLFEMIRYHQELLYHPSTHVTQAYNRYFNRKDYDSLKSWFYDAMKGRYMMVHPTDFHNNMINKAFENEDYETVVDVYLDCIDYKLLNKDSFLKALDSVSYEESIDHVLVGHIKEHMDNRKLDARLQMAVYYLHAQGGLTSADLLNSLAEDSQISKIPNSH